MSAVASSSAYATTSSKCSQYCSASTMKELNRLAAQLRPIEKLSFNQLNRHPHPETINSLITKIRRCARGIDTIPMAMKSQVLERDADLVSEDNVWRADLLTDTDPTILPSTLIPQPHGILPTLLQAEMIVDQARECQDTDASEAGWNS